MLLSVAGVSTTGRHVLRSSSGPHVAHYETLPLSFEPNRGQTDRRVAFMARGRGYTAFLVRSGAVLALERQHGGREVALGLDFVRGGRSGPLLASARLPGRTSYFTGRDPGHWATGVPTYARVTQRGVWPGIDVRWHGTQRRLEYDLVVAPRADPGRIHLRFRGAVRLALGQASDLRVYLPGGGFVAEPAPVAFQSTQAGRVRVTARYFLRGRRTVGIRLGNHDGGAPVLIDPGLVYSTYLGGRDSDAGTGIAVDSQGAAYVTGWTTSARFPTLRGSYRPGRAGASDAFVAKLNPAGTSLTYATYLGGRQTDKATGIAVDETGAAYVSGWTDSTDFPVTAGAFRSRALAEPQVFVAKLNPAGTGLSYSTYLGPIASLSQFNPIIGDLSLSRPLVFPIAVDNSGAAYVTGWTTSASFPTTPSAFQPDHRGFIDVFVSKLSPDGSALAYSTFLSGTDGVDNAGNAIAVDKEGAAYVAGHTNSRDFPTTNGALRTKYLVSQDRGGSAFVTKLTPDGSGLSYSTYLGGRHAQHGGTGALGVAVDASGAAFVTGFTYAHDFPVTRGAAQTRFRCCTDVFVSKLTPAGNGLSYSTFLGGRAYSLGNGGTGIAVDARDEASVTGWTDPADPPRFRTTRGAFQRTRNGCCSWAFVTKLNPSGTRLAYSSYLGGPGNPGSGFAEDGGGIAVDRNGDIYVTGSTYSHSFPTSRRPIQRRYGGGPKVGDLPGGDAFVTKLSP